MMKKFEQFTNDTVYDNLVDRIGIYTKELELDRNNRTIKFIPKDESDSILYKITVGLYELNFVISTFSKDNDYFIWKY